MEKGKIPYKKKAAQESGIAYHYNTVIDSLQILQSDVDKSHSTNTNFLPLRYDIKSSTMTLGDTLISIWQQVLAEGKSAVDLEGKTYSVGKTRAKRLRVVHFDYTDYRLDGIEQNPSTTSQWAALAREGKRVMQFSCQNRYIANVCEGNLTRYPAWRALHLAE